MVSRAVAHRMKAISIRRQHPYSELEGSPLWKAVEKQIAALVKNGDLKEMTAREYIVGAICGGIACGNPGHESCAAG